MTLEPVSQHLVLFHKWLQLHIFRMVTPFSFRQFSDMFSLDLGGVEIEREGRLVGRDSREKRTPSPLNML